MSRAREIERRAFLRGAGAATALGLAAPALLAFFAGCGRESPLARSLSGFFADPESARAVGREYLELSPDMPDAAAVLERLAGSRLREWEALYASDPDRLAQSLRLQHGSDFAHERVVAIRGWVLSETEARLCALAELAARSRSDPG
ncbi:MAG: hypothetical protein JRS35_00690 [Deltaproteobacteria bacterium]|nr:hypothetical protein [Deltaproteobacteria bacterium]